MAERICPQCGLETAATVCPHHQCPTVARPSGSLSQLQAGTVVDHRYRIEGQLGKGGFGAVFLASHVATRQQVVLKVLKPDLTEDPTQVQRFYNEARASSLLSHPHTVRVHDFGQTDGGLLYIAMERLHGRELAQAIKEAPGGRIAPLRLARIAVAVCKSLSEAHHAGLVHRDLKPDNVFLCNVHGEDEFVKVIDFGIAKPVDAPVDGGLTRTGFTVGTPKYMSPEQVMQRSLDGRSDLYSLGIVMYQCLCGDVPFSGTTPMETLMAHVQMQAVPLTQRMTGLPASLVAVVEKAMAKQPAERFADADAMRTALADVLIELQDSSSPPTQTGRRNAVVVREPAPLVAAQDAKPQPMPADIAPAPAPAVRTATTQPAAHKLRTAAQAPKPKEESTEPHAEVFAVASKALVVAAPEELPPAETREIASEPEVTLYAQSAEELPPAETRETPSQPELTLYAQSAGDPLDMPTARPSAMRLLLADTDTALLEHPTLRDDYQPQTLSLPTQKLAEPLDHAGETLMHAAPLREPAPVKQRSRSIASLLTLVVVGAIAAVSLAIWAKSTPPSPQPEDSSSLSGSSVLAAPATPPTAAPADPPAAAPAVPPAAPAAPPPVQAAAPSAPQPVPELPAVAAAAPATVVAAPAQAPAPPPESAQAAPPAPKPARKAPNRARPSQATDGDKAL
jgi:serine/threonine-protein kinase